MDTLWGRQAGGFHATEEEKAKEKHRLAAADMADQPLHAGEGIEKIVFPKVPRNRIAKREQ
ncbi:MAG: hypothetical protein FJ405_05445 [Verrucomicrobia bacterium]|nr:hypothetical protein [Verrucomicrobiota bacterium]